MSYLVLARKYRPRTFTEVAGQQTAMRTLENAIREDRLGHAYLFCGSRGTGKTTTARILAKALLCEKGPTPEPCGECDQCRDVEAGRHVDVTEIDAASNRGIDAVRELRDGVGYAPMRARYRIYIVDEVHQITKEGFNAFLKTLEEPPAHVKFFFATTEVDKVIETVRSRCQIVRLSLIAEDVIAAHLADILGREGVTPGPGVTAGLAKLARGSMRDALTLTDQLIALVGAEPVAEDVQRVAPHSSDERAGAVLDAIESGDGAAVLSNLPRSEGAEVELCSALLETLRLSLVCALCPDDAALFEPDAERRARLGERAKRLGPERMQLWLEELLHARERMALVPRHARIVLEVTLLDLSRPAASMPLSVLEQRLVALEARIASGASATRPIAAATLTPAPRPTVAAPAPSTASPQSTAAQAPAPHAAPARPATTQRDPQPPTRASNGDAPAPRRSTPPPTSNVASSAPRPSPRSNPPTAAAAQTSHASAWAAALEVLGHDSDALAGALSRCGALVDVGDGRAVVRITRPTDPEKALFADRAAAASIAGALSRVLGRTMEVVIDDPAQRPSGQDDEFTRSVADLFAGQIEELDR